MGPMCWPVFLYYSEKDVLPTSASLSVYNISFVHLGNYKQIFSNVKIKFPAWAFQWYFSPDQNAQLQFEITMKNSVICLFRANPAGATSDLTSLFSNIRGQLCFRFLSTVSRSNELPLSFNPCVGGEGFPSSDPIVSLKHRTERRVLGSELLTLHSLAAVVKRTLRLQGVSLFLPFLFSPKELPFLPHPPPLKYRKNMKAEEGNKLAIYQRYRETQQESRQGWKKCMLLLLGYAPNKEDTENILGKAGLWFKDIRILSVLPQGTMCKRKN